MPQFTSPEISVYQFGVSSSIAVTTYLIRAPVPRKFSDDGDTHESCLGDDDQEEG